jgi:hypothetical protein
MKGLSLTLTVVVVAIALIVTVLVVVTVFSEQVANFIGVLNPWSEEKVFENMCRDKCATYCTAHAGERGTDWSGLDATVQGVKRQCDDVMRSVLGDDIGTCRC